MNFHCPGDNDKGFIAGITSPFHKWWTDRKFKFQCCEEEEEPEVCLWTDWSEFKQPVNDYKDISPPPGYYINGIQSNYSDKFLNEDRKFRYYVCATRKWTLKKINILGSNYIIKNEG